VSVGMSLVISGGFGFDRIPAFMRVPRDANRPKVVAQVVAIYGPRLGTLHFDFDGTSRPP
jgi:hypothetical protein